MKKLFLIGLLFYSFNSSAQEGPQKLIDEFFNLYKNKGTNEAIDYIFSTNKWMKDSKDQIESVKIKLNGTLKQIGDYNGYNLITIKTLGDHLSLYTFMVRYDRQPLRFSLLFYKPQEQWRLQNFSYDASIPDELEEASKAYRLKENLDY